MPSKPIARIAIENVVSPGRIVRVDAAKYEAMKKAVVAVLPKKSPGLTSSELKTRVLPLLPEAQFPGGDKAGWWLKAVQLDLEAKGLIAREETKPLRFRRR
jgi:hypothetical protein